MSMKINQQGIEYKLATSDDAVDMVNFHNSYFGSKRKTEHWLWEHKTYKHDEAVFVFARDHKRVVATQAVMPVMMEVGAELVLSGKVENVLLLRPYRGLGIMPKLHKYAVKNCMDRGVQFLWGFTGAPTLSKNFQYFPIAQIMVKPGNILVEVISKLGIESALHTPRWRGIGSMAKLILKSGFKKQAYSNTNIEKLPGYEIKKGERCDELQLKNLYQRLKGLNRNMINISLDREYLKWRIREHPFIRYEDYQIYKKGALCGYAFVGHYGGVASISDLTSEDPYAISLLLKTIIVDYKKEAGRFQLLGNSEDSLARDVLSQSRKFGFLPYATWQFGIKDLTGGKFDHILDVSNWHTNGLWTEGYSM